MYDDTTVGQIYISDIFTDSVDCTWEIGIIIYIRRGSVILYFLFTKQEKDTVVLQFRVIHCLGVMVKG